MSGQKIPVSETLLQDMCQDCGYNYGKSPMPQDTVVQISSISDSFVVSTLFFACSHTLTFQANSCLIYVMKCSNWHIFSERIGSEDKLYHRQHRLTNHFGKTLTILRLYWGFHTFNQTES